MNKTLRKVKGVIRSLKQRHLDNFVFIHINKTGGSSVEKALKLPFAHRTALEKIEEMGREAWDRKLTFTVVRNPWDKVVSHYHYRVKTNKTDLRDKPIEFREWVKLAYGDRDPLYCDPPRMFMPQLDWITDENGKVLVDEIIRLENIDSEFDALLKKLGRTATLPHVKKSNRGSYKDYYDEETIEIVRSCFEKDIERFGYDY